MDVTDVEFRLHPKAKDYLFEHYITLRKIFSGVLGQVETDYLSIVFINQSNEIFFLSSKPSIEQNLIEKKIWQYDSCFQPSFINQNEPMLWSEFPCSEYSEQIKKYKLQNHDFMTGIIIPTVFKNYNVLFSFGFKKLCPLIQNKVQYQCDKLLAIGKYCLREIEAKVPLADEKKNFISKPKLKLIINNLVNYEQNS